MADIKYLNNFLKHNRQVCIYLGTSRHDRNWKNAQLMWAAFVNRLKTPVVSPEPLEEYERLSKTRQGELKDVGGFVGGEFEGNRRTANSLKHRDFISLDIDNASPGETEAILKKLHTGGCAFVVYSTRSHRPDRPRLRVLIPTDRSVTPDEYEPLARITAQKLGVLKNCDPTTFQANRLMYFPSCSSNSEYVFEINDAPFLCVSAVLESFKNWKDVESWPALPDEKIRYLKKAKQQASPVTKAGLVGAFCRAYDIEEAIAEFLPDLYTEAGENRYTYLKGTTAGGAVLYGDGLFLFSHHATDPCCGRLVNAFDLVRIHLFGDLDGKMEPDTPEHKTPSYEAMIKRALDDPKVCALMQDEKKEHIRDIFQAEAAVEENTEWVKLLSYKKDGSAKASVENIVTILTYDPLLKGKIAIDEFTARLTVTGSLPWNNDCGIRGWTDVDDAGLYYYLEVGYQIAASANMLRAVSIISFRNQYNSVEQYLNSLIWDGKPRIATLLVDYFGAEENIYTKEVMLIVLPNAVERAIIGGTKFDQVPILVGPQGSGKSTFLEKLGGQWFNDSLQTFEGKDAYELIQGSWVVELPELAAFRKSEIDKIKQFISKTKDNFRAAYAKRVKESRRRCVFFGTTNNHEFLRDSTGERRFWPVVLGVTTPTKSVFDDLTPDEVDQIWAEALTIYRAGNLKKDMRGEAARLAREAQQAHKEVDPWYDDIFNFLEKPKPANWEDLDLIKRQLFMKGRFETAEELTYLISKTRAKEIFAECLGKQITEMTWRDSKRICDVVRTIPGWIDKMFRNPGDRRPLRGFVRVKE